MLLTITYNGKNTEELGFLLHKNPQSFQEFKLTYGSCYVFYPEVSHSKTTIALVLDIDPIDLSRGKVASRDGGLFDYVNDRPYVCSSFMSNAISKVFGTALSGRSKERQELADSKLNLEVKLNMLPIKGDLSLVNRIFEPLGYKVKIEEFQNDDKFSEWGKSPYINLKISGNVKISELLNHLYILIPVFDKSKHYYISKDEIDKLLHHGKGWLSDHPESKLITYRYLNKKKSFANEALKKLSENELEEENNVNINITPKLNDIRLNEVVNTLKSENVKIVGDLGCGEGKLINLLLKDSFFTKISGMDVSFDSIERAKSKLKAFPELKRNIVNLFQGSLLYRDKRLENHDGLCLVEVIEHLDESKLNFLESVVFKYSNANVIIVTTPNREYNNFYNIVDGNLRHSDHRFEWTRDEFKCWAEDMCKNYGYNVYFKNIGEENEGISPTQMGVFVR